MAAHSNSTPAPENTPPPRPSQFRIEMNRIVDRLDEEASRVAMIEYAVIGLRHMHMNGFKEADGVIDTLIQIRSGIESISSDLFNAVRA